MREELKTLQALNSRLKQKINELEEDLKKSKEEMEKYSKSNKSDDEVRSYVFVISSRSSGSVDTERDVPGPHPVPHTLPWSDNPRPCGTTHIVFLFYSRKSVYFP